MTLSAFLAIAFLHAMAAISPGPSVLMAARTGVTHGFRAATGVAIGIGIGGVIWAMAALFGLSLLFTYMPALLWAFKLCGGAFLVYMAIKLWKQADTPIETDGSATPPSFGRGVVLGLVTQLANPKPAVLFAAIFLGTVPAGVGIEVYAALLAVVFFNETAWNILVGRIFSLPATRRSYLGLKGAIDRVFGGLLAALGVKIAAT
ncbi:MULTISPECIES: LysE family translocator [Halocynthiibacter]|uniref:LysE family translocator n=1 Tax=Halocynthiibacter halioticoli TaxID=2986804 RepID=A0AAE3LSY8_9RHOB|nr:MULTISPECIES: LysE family translocator [Halocynthiibacter]MCV6824186.1 LysE family translocator [Halocynthiibacter halioticoli]MCW4057187.1 LysE family translocator [Halocynthiibacter sp. SDUM655004]